MFKKIKEYFFRRKFNMMELEYRRFYCFSSWSEKNQPKKNESFKSYLKRYMNAIKE